SLAAGLMPPVLDVPFEKLTGSRVEEMAANKARRRQQQRQRILQLIAKAEGAARLVKGRTPPDSAGQRLVEEPPVQHHVHRPVRGADRDHAKEIGPVRCRPAQRLVYDVTTAMPLDEIPCVRLILSIAKDTDHDLFFT